MITVERSNRDIRSTMEIAGRLVIQLTIEQPYFLKVRN